MGQGSQNIVEFYVGLHQPSDAHRFGRACISINRLRGRRKQIVGCRVLVDSGAFTELHLHGCYRHGVEEYARELHRLYTEGVIDIAAVVAQDYMCEPFMLAKTGLTVEDHQRLTISRYDALYGALNRAFGSMSAIDVKDVMAWIDGASKADLETVADELIDRDLCASTGDLTDLEHELSRRDEEDETDPDLIGEARARLQRREYREALHMLAAALGRDFYALEDIPVRL